MHGLSISIYWWVVNWWCMHHQASATKEERPDHPIPREFLPVRAPRREAVQVAAVGVQTPCMPTAQWAMVLQGRVEVRDAGRRGRRTRLTAIAATRRAGTGPRAPSCGHF